jgi:hypothetical protein
MHVALTVMFVISAALIVWAAYRYHYDAKQETLDKHRNKFMR